jgi:hypothetical protein
MVKIKPTMSGSIGSGSVPVTPFGVEDEELVGVGGVVEVGLLSEANACTEEEVANRTRSRTKVSLGIDDLAIE